jgi:hypothetical protein
MHPNHSVSFCVCHTYINIYFSLSLSFCKNVDIHTYMHACMQTDGQTYRHTDIQTDIHTYRQIYSYKWCHRGRTSIYGPCPAQLTCGRRPLRGSSAVTRWLQTPEMRFCWWETRIITPKWLWFGVFKEGYMIYMRMNHMGWNCYSDFSVPI